ncbi:MAG TPA: SIS domain-containing protein [Thermoplasmataceae archaeon]|nr:SIS domain-containing protein [Thermoplasmataceae archaeon]
MYSSKNHDGPGWEHSMMFREIRQQTDTVSKAFYSGRKSGEELADLIKKSKLVYISGSGSSYHAGLIFQFLLMRCGIPSMCVRASEFESYLPVTPSTSGLVLFFSQSGEGYDILNALKVSRQRGLQSISITNNSKSSLADGSDASVDIGVGEEKSIAATKTFTGEVMAAIGIYSQVSSKPLEKDVNILGKHIDNIVGRSKQLESIAGNLPKRIVILGNGILFPVALEGGLKFRETAEAETESYPIREYLHGPIQTLNKEKSVVVLRGTNESGPQTLPKEILSLAHGIYTIGSAGDDNIPIDSVTFELSPILYTIPLQLLANIKAYFNGLDPDKPSNLRKVIN